MAASSNSFNFHKHPFEADEANPQLYRMVMKMIRFTSAAGCWKVNTADTAPTQLLPAVQSCLVNPDSLLDAPVAEGS